MQRITNHGAKQSGFKKHCLAIALPRNSSRPGIGEIIVVNYADRAPGEPLSVPGTLKTSRLSRIPQYLKKLSDQSL